MKISQQTYWQIFLIPMLLGFVSLVGLLSALLGDGIWDVISWLTLFMPVLAILGYPSYLHLVKKKRAI